jgi:CRP-like cAMP-binding protein
MPERGLQLTLEAGQSLPVNLCWRVKHGFLRAIACTELADNFTLGIWGPGEVVIPELLNLHSLELRALSQALVHEWHPDQVEHHRCCTIQIKQMGMLLRLSRTRPAEARLIHLLIWLAERFGTTTEQGRTVPLEAMNLTHRQMAEMASVSRVTVTKALGHFRQQGWLFQVGDVEVLSATSITAFQGFR